MWRGNVVSNAMAFNLQVTSSFWTVCSSSTMRCCICLQVWLSCWKDKVHQYLKHLTGLWVNLDYRSKNWRQWIPWADRCRPNSHFRVESLWAYRSRCGSSVEPLRRHASTSSTARHLQQRYIISWRNIDVSKKKQKIAIGFTQCYWASRLLSWRWLLSLKVSQCFRNEEI